MPQCACCERCRSGSLPYIRRCNVQRRGFPVLNIRGTEPVLLRWFPSVTDTCRATISNVCMQMFWSMFVATFHLRAKRETWSYTALKHAGPDTAFMNGAAYYEPLSIAVWALIGNVLPLQYLLQFIGSMRTQVTQILGGMCKGSRIIRLVIGRSDLRVTTAYHQQPAA